MAGRQRGWSRRIVDLVEGSHGNETSIYRMQNGCWRFLFPFAHKGRREEIARVAQIFLDTILLICPSG